MENICRQFFFIRLENNVGKGENADLPAFSLFPTMFSKGFFLRVVKSWYCVVKSKELHTRTRWSLSKGEPIHKGYVTIKGF